MQTRYSLIPLVFWWSSQTNLPRVHQNHHLTSFTFYMYLVQNCAEHKTFTKENNALTISCSSSSSSHRQTCTQIQPQILLNDFLSDNYYELHDEYYITLRRVLQLDLLLQTI